MRKTGIYIVPFFIAIWLSGCQMGKQDTIICSSDVNTLQLHQCIADSANTYWLYLPLSYTNERKWPVLFVFDPHGDGRLPLDTIKNYAECYGFVLVGSNAVSNHTVNMGQVISVLMDDVSKRFSVDGKRISVCGFSGGARIALSLALNQKYISNIVMCGAGISGQMPVSSQQKLNILFISGDGDFNYLEVLNSVNYLSNSVNACFQVFEGGHHWPPSQIFNEVFSFILLNEMKAGIIPKDNAFINNYYKGLIKKTDNLMKENHVYEAVGDLKNGKMLLTGLRNTGNIHKKISKISKGHLFLTQNNNRNTIFYKEELLQQEYLKNVITKDTLWWRNEIKKIDSLSITDKDVHKKALYKRIRNYLGILGYSLSKQYLVGKQTDLGEKAVRFYQCIEPENADCMFFKAVLEAQKGNLRESQKIFHNARTKGFNDLALARQLLPASFY